MRQNYREMFGEGAAVVFDTTQAAQQKFTAADYEHAAALDAVAEQHASVSHFRPPTAAAYAAMGGLYVTDPRQRAGPILRSRRGWHGRSKRTRA